MNYKRTEKLLGEHQQEMRRQMEKLLNGCIEARKTEDPLKVWIADDRLFRWALWRVPPELWEMADGGVSKPRSVNPSSVFEAATGDLPATPSSEKA